VTRDETRWVETADEPIVGQTTYERVRVSPELPPTDEVRTAEELEETEAIVEAEVEAHEAAEAENEVNATDAAIELADELGIDISTVAGTGHDGRVTKADVEAAAEG
jgi:pyruvate/2-oxoglutarate dehydrogenase complex dihydrolipoamide acyltransferase (E2) component